MEPMGNVVDAVSPRDVKPGVLDDCDVIPSLRFGHEEIDVQIFWLLL